MCAIGRAVSGDSLLKEILTTIREYTPGRSSLYAIGPDVHEVILKILIYGLRHYFLYINRVLTIRFFYYLRKHQLIHMEEKPFACDWPGCHYRSVRACDVANHKITHTGEKRFVCEYPNCGKGFARSHHLKVSVFHI